MSLDIEKIMRDLYPVVVPTTPGRYLDNSGHPWELKADGRWYDRSGETRDASNNWMLTAIGPFTENCR